VVSIEQNTKKTPSVT